MTDRAPAQGFTLLEVLISIAITSLLLTAGFTAFRAITQIQERARPEMNRGQSARVLLDRLESELLGTMLVVKRPFTRRLSHPWLFIGEDRVFGTADSDSLRFVTANPARPPGAQSETGIRMISYAVGEVDGDRHALYRSETRLPRQMVKRVDLRRAAPVIHDVASLRLRYLSEDGWRTTWDSTQVSQLDQLPLAIEISLQLYEEQRDGGLAPGRVHTRTIPIPVRPLNPTGVDALDASCPGGITVRGCLLRLDPQIKRLNSVMKKAITDMRGATPDRCWNPGNPTPHLELLKDGLDSALLRGPDELCK